MTAYDDRPWLALYAQGQPTEFIPEKSSLLAALHDGTEADPDAPQLHYFDRTLSRRDLDEHSTALGAGLLAHEVVPGDRVALYMQNMPQYVIALLAIWKIGAIAVAVSPMYKARELRQLLLDSEAVAVVALDDLWAAYGAEASEGSAVRVVVTTSGRDYQSRDDARAFGSARSSTVDGHLDLVHLVDSNLGAEIDEAVPSVDAPAILTYTSGTTGAPKGVISTHGNVQAGAQTYRDWFRVGAGDVILGIAPLFHVTGLTGHIGLSLMSGAPLVLHYRFDLGIVLDAIAQRRPTFTVGASTVFVALMNSDLVTAGTFETFRTIATGGAAIAPATLERFRDVSGLYIHNVYGMTETTSPTHQVPMGVEAPFDPASGAVSVGIPVQGAGSWILDESGAEVRVGEIGELAVTGPRITPGYWHRDAETAASFIDDRFKTGDLAFMDPLGWFYLVDRKKDMIVASGFKIYPREVEDVLYEHPAVLEAAVVGVPDDYRGESVKAFVSLKAGMTATSAELAEFCKARMAAYKYPREIEILPELPKTVTGKILRRDLR